MCVVAGSSGRRKPTWQVLGVFDPDGTGQDFAYTIGLAERGLPELHLTARPTHGDDPGVDWLLSMNDRCSILNEFAFDLIEGRLRLGAEFERLVDGDRTRLQFSVAGPLLPADVDAHQLDNDTPVWALRWSLHREPVGDPRPVEHSRRAELRDLTIRLGSSFAPSAIAEPLSDSLLEGVRVVAETAFDSNEESASQWAGQAFDATQDSAAGELGPCLALSVVSAGALLALEGGAFDSWVYGSLALGAVAPLRSWFADIEAVARTSGRTGAVQAVRGLVDDVMVEWSPGNTSEEEGRAFEQFCRTNLQLLFAASAVADQLPPQRLAALFGPLLLATGGGVPAQWAENKEAVAEALATVPVTELAQAALGVQDALEGESGDEILRAAGVALASGVPALGAEQVLSSAALGEYGSLMGELGRVEKVGSGLCGWVVLLLSEAARDFTDGLRQSWPPALREVSW